MIPTPKLSVLAPVGHAHLGPTAVRAQAPAGVAAPRSEAGESAPSVWLWRLTLVLLLAAALTTLAWAVDDRRLGHSSVWAKPLKFQLALALHAATFAWALPYLAPAFRRVAMPSALLGAWSAVALYEVFYITLQGGRGVASHFNRGTPWESVGGSLMAAGAGVLVCVTFWIGAVALCQVWRRGVGAAGAASPAKRQRRQIAWTFATPLMPLAIGLGFTFGAVLAAWSGSDMGAARGYWPQPLQQPVLWMPLTGWVLSQTDLRIAHFIGLHQMQFLPALAALAAWAGWRPRSAGAALVTAAVASVAAVGWLLQP